MTNAIETQSEELASASPATGQAVLPFYIVCDESHSMTGSPIDAVNGALPDIHATIASDPLVSDKCRVGLIAFSDTAEVLLPLSKLSEVSDMPGMTPKGLTSYGEAFRCLKTRIEEDIDALRSQGFRVFRPAVFFISDGEPTDAWEHEYKVLMDPNGRYPHIIAYGVAGANAGTIGKIGTKQAFVQDPDSSVGPAEVLREILHSLTNTIVSSTGRAEPTLVIPPAPDGTVAVPLEEV